MAHYFCVIMTVDKSLVYAAHSAQLVISNTSFYHIMHMLV